MEELPEAVDPEDYLRLLQYDLSVLRGRALLLEHADELRVIEMKRGSRRWLPRREA